MNDLETRVAKLEAEVAALRANGIDRNAVADDADLDSQYGNPTIRFDPREKYWAGVSYVGKTFSQCPAEYLDAQAKYLSAAAYMARKNGEDKKAGYKDKDAARARGWAKRVRAGLVTRTVVPEAEYTDDPGEVDGEVYAAQYDTDAPF
jgi:hypothetical protein